MKNHPAPSPAFAAPRHTRVVEDAPFYLPPTQKEIRAEAKRVGLKAYHKGLFEDLCHLAAHLDKDPQSFPLRDIREAKEKEARRYKKHTDQAEKKASKAVDGLCDALNALRPYLRQGKGSPIERAALALKALQKGGMEQGEGGDADSLPIMGEGSGKEAAETLKDIETLESEMAEEAESLEKDESGEDGEGEDGEGEDGEGEEDGEEGEDDDDDEEDEEDEEEEDEEDEEEEEDEAPPKAGKSGRGQGGKRLAARLLDDEQARLILEVARICRETAGFHTPRSMKAKADPQGADRRWREMREVSELPKTSASSWALRNVAPSLFTLRLAQKTLPVRENVKREDKKQVIFFLGDASGSMTDQNCARLMGVLFDRLEAVKKGEAILHYAFFDTELRKERGVVQTKEDAEALLKSYRSGKYPASGGGTSFDGALKEAVRVCLQEVENGREKPEIIIVTDGGDRLHLTHKDLCDVKLHVALIKSNNFQLEKLAAQSGGIVLKF